MRMREFPPAGRRIEALPDCALSELRLTRGFGRRCRRRARAATLPPGRGRLGIVQGNRACVVRGQNLGQLSEA